LDKNKLFQLLKKEEGPKLDFKLQLHLDTDGEKRELTRDVLAMANSIGGRGYIIFGVEDKTKEIVGIDPQVYVEERIQQIIYNRCEPPVPIELDFFEINKKTIAVMTIYKSTNKPHQLTQNGAFYIRRGSTTDTARRIEVAKMLQENGLLSFETVVLKKAKVDELNRELIFKFFENLGVKSDEPNEVLLDAMGIIGKLDYSDEYRPTIGGMLLFGKDPLVHIPHAYVMVVKGKEKKMFSGDIIKILDEVSEYMETIIEDEKYPVDAVKETIANALVHRDYLDSSRGIKIFINYKTIEISNPGAIVGKNGIYRILKEKNPTRRNAWLYQKLLILDSKKRFMSTGRSFSQIKRKFHKYEDMKILNFVEENIFKVLFPRKLKKKMKNQNKHKKNYHKKLHKKKGANK
jgi:ATP-dependent DNA helicase RecG